MTCIKRVLGCVLLGPFAVCLCTTAAAWAGARVAVLTLRLGAAGVRRFL